MKKFLILLMIGLISSCTVFEAGRIDADRKKLYEKNNNKEFCDKNPKRCVNNIPWS